jgi:hypothetical protein
LLKIIIATLSPIKCFYNLWTLDSTEYFPLFEAINVYSEVPEIAILIKKPHVFWLNNNVVRVMPS